MRKQEMRILKYLLPVLIVAAVTVANDGKNDIRCKTLVEFYDKYYISNSLWSFNDVILSFHFLDQENDTTSESSTNQKKEQNDGKQKHNNNKT